MRTESELPQVTDRSDVRGLTADTCGQGSNFPTGLITCAGTDARHVGGGDRRAESWSSETCTTPPSPTKPVPLSVPLSAWYSAAPHARRPTFLQKRKLKKKPTEKKEHATSA